MKKFLNFVNKHKYFLIALGLSMVFLLLACYNKNTYHVDESLSYSLANYDMGWMNYPHNGIMTQYVMDGYKVTNNAFSYDMVWHWQALDEHPPLYYAALHTVSSFFPYTLSKWYGLSINIISSIIIQVFIYRLLLKLTNNNYLVSAFMVLLYGLNPTVINYSLTIRMYVMLGATFISFIYYAFCYLEGFKNKYLVYLFVITVIGGLTNYFYYVFLVIVCSLILIYLLLNRVKLIEIIKPVGTIVAATITNLIVFPYTLELFFQENNSAIIASKNFKNSIINFDRVKLMLEQSPLGLILTIIMVGLVLIYILNKMIKRKSLQNSYAFILLITYSAYFCLISTLSFQASYRFVCGIDGLLFIVIGYCLSNCFSYFNLKQLNQISICAMVFVGSLFFTGINRFQILAYEPMEIAKINRGGNLMVFSEVNQSRYIIDSIFIERNEYGFVYNTDGKNVDKSKDDLYWMEEAIVYVDSTFDIQFVKDWLFANAGFNVLEDLKTSSHGYHLFKAIK